MKRKLFATLFALVVSVASYAQFEQGKMYMNANLSGMNMNYTGADKWKFDFGVRGGYMFEDSWMALGEIEYKYRKYEPKSMALGAAIRYYVTQNGLYLGAGAKYQHSSYAQESFNDLVPNVQIGYCYFLSKTVTLEPEFYYNQSLKDHSNYSGAGIRLGIGIFLDEIIF